MEVVKNDRKNPFINKFYSVIGDLYKLNLGLNYEPILLLKLKGLFYLECIFFNFGHSSSSRIYPTHLEEPQLQI